MAQIQQHSSYADWVRRRSSAVPASSTFMVGVYRWMAIALALTGSVAWFVANTPSVAQMVLGNRWVFFGLMIAELLMVVTFSVRVASASFAAAAAMFLGYALLNGVTLSTIFMVYTSASIARAFFVSSATFGVLSAYGALAKRDLTAMGQFMQVGLIGLVIATVVNIFLQSEAVYWVSTYAGVMIFAGLTAYDTQKLKRLYAAQGGQGNLALIGALTLYLDLVNLFLMMLRLFDDRR